MRHVERVVLLPKPQERTGRALVEIRRVHARDVGQEDQRVFALPCQQHLIDLLVGHAGHAPLAEPLQAHAAALDHAEHHMRVRQKAVVQRDAAVSRGGLGAHGRQRHDRAGGERHGAHAGVSGPDHAGKVIQRAHVDVRDALQAEALRDLREHLARRGTRLHQRRKLRLAHADALEHLLPVALAVNVEIEREGGDRAVGAQPPRQAIDHIVL